jgi:hypothetical protein
MRKYHYQKGKEPSECTEPAKFFGLNQGCFWQGMNGRDETDEVTRLPVGRCLKVGFAMLNDDELLAD